MTIEEAKKKLVDIATSQIGYHEGANNWNKYAEEAGIKKLYGWYPQNQPYCDIFVDWCFIQAFSYDLASAMTFQYTGKGSAACNTSANYYMSHNSWYDSPEVGDQIFFYVGSKIDHTGIVTNVGTGSVTTVEGNSGDMVARRVYDLRSQNIAGYGRPKWSLVENYEPPEDPDAPEPIPEKPKTFVKVELEQLEEGAVGDTVKAAQALLAQWGFTCGWYGADGEFGPATKQATINFQFMKKLELDGIIGQHTWNALLGVG